LELLWLFDAAQITDSGLAHIAKLHNLRFLFIGGGRQNVSDIQDCVKITDESVVNLCGLKNLEVLKSNIIKVNQAGKNKLRDALPNCRFEWNADSPNATEF
jgi:hypothetical protein